MEINNRFIINNIYYTVVKPLDGGKGGQGSLWIVKNDTNEQFVLKIINEEDQDIRLSKIDNMRYLQREKLIIDKLLLGKDFTFTLPIGIFYQGSEVGYIMNKCEGKTIERMIIDGTISKLSLNEKLTIIKKICSCMKFLQNKGLCYQDISLRNFMYNENTNVMTAIDCDNIAENAKVQNKERAYVLGTGFFMAPEVAFGLEAAAGNADAYAFATLAYMILVGTTDSPYHGKILYENLPLPMNMLDAAELTDQDELDIKWLTFIFDPFDDVNTINDIYRNSTSPINIEKRNEFDKMISEWEQIPENLKQLFYLSFKAPLLKESYRKRPLFLQWETEINKIINSDIKKPEDEKIKTSKENNKPNDEEKNKVIKVNYNTPTITLYSKKVFSLTENELVISGLMIDYPKLRNFGIIRKNANGYEFESTSIHLLEHVSSNNQILTELREKNKTFSLESGSKIQLSVNRNIFIIFKY